MMGRWKGIVYMAVALSLVAALIHAVVMPEHMAEWWGYGVFFLVTALAQGLYAVALLRWARPPLFAIGIVGNLAVIGLYIVTRTVGVPFFGPGAGEMEAVGPLDLASKVVEAMLIITLMALLLRAAARRTRLERT